MKQEIRFTIYDTRRRGDMEILNAKHKRRDQLSIVAAILDITKGATLKTQIMYKANLSFTQLNDYLSFMLRTNLISQTSIEGKEVYSITPFGLNFLQKHSELIRLLKSKK